MVKIYFLVIGAMLVAFFLITVWLLSPSSEVIPEEYGLSISMIPSKGNGKSKILKGVSKNDTNSLHKTEAQIKVADEHKDANEDGLAKGKGRQEDAVPSDQKVDDKVQTEITTQAESEFKKENNEMPRIWSTHSIESNEEKKMVKSSNEIIKNIQGMDEKVDDHFEMAAKVEADKLDQEKRSRTKHLYGDGRKGDKLEGRNGAVQVSGKMDELPAGRGQEEASNETDEDMGGIKEDTELDFEIDAERGACILDHAKSNISEYLHVEGSEWNQSRNHNISAKATENRDGKSALQQRNDKRIADVWKECKWQGAIDYIPCLDNKGGIKKLSSTGRERYCPLSDNFHMCLVPLPRGYKIPIHWPRSRNEIWFNNVPHPKLVSYKKDQNWVRMKGDKLIFPGGGTQFKRGALDYIESIEKCMPDIAWGEHTRVVLDIGCGVASFGGYLFDRNVLTMSFAPKDEHEAQVQLALERGIPAIIAVLGSQRLLFPSNAYDLVHCARCRISWHRDGGKRLLEVNRVLRPGGYFVWSATPVYQDQPEDLDAWTAMVALTESMCWNLTIKAKGLASGIGVAIFQKPTSNICYEKRVKNKPPICSEKEKPDAAWRTPLENCLQVIPTDGVAHKLEWPLPWPERCNSTPGWHCQSLFGEHASVEFQQNNEHWRRVIAQSYVKGLGIDWGSIRNVMDMKAGYGGFAAALSGQLLWVLNVVPTDEPDTLPIIFDRGLFGIYHDWCEPFSTYPRTYDLLHVDHLFKQLSLRCKPTNTLLEMDRILRPKGWVIFREKCSILKEIFPIISSLHWHVQVMLVEGQEQLLVAQKGFWRP